MQDLVELLEGQLVALLELPVVLRVLLHRIVGQMDVRIRDVLKVELLSRRPQVTFREHVHVQRLGHQYPHSDVEFAILNQQGLLDVLLDDELMAANFALVLAGSLFLKDLL